MGTGVNLGAVSLLFQFHLKALYALARLRLLNVLFRSPQSLNPCRFAIILDQ